MRTTVIVFALIVASLGCTKEPNLVDIEKMVEDVLAEMDWHPRDEDTLIADSDLVTDTEPDKDSAADADITMDAAAPADDDMLLSDD